MPPSRADEFLGVGGPPVYGRPAYTFEEDVWTPCPAAQQGVSAWDGCDPFSDPSSSFHYAKPYGTPSDAAALALWEPGRGERGWEAYQRTGHYYQSDQWDGPVSWNDGYYGGTRDGRMCGGAYAENFRVADQTVSEPGHGGQGCY
jgi:hypothetical protein